MDFYPDCTLYLPLNFNLSLCMSTFYSVVILKWLYYLSFVILFALCFIWNVGQDGITVKKVNDDEEEKGMISNKRPLKAMLSKDMAYGRFVKVQQHWWWTGLLRRWLKTEKHIHLIDLLLV